MVARLWPMRISIVLFEGFELLDVFGPVELFSFIEDWDIEFLAPTLEPVASSQGVQVIPTGTYMERKATDLLLVPGGKGTRVLAEDTLFLAWLASIGEHSTIVSSVCTGSALLAQAGLLENHRATSNKLAFEWVTGFGKNIDWQSRARWVHDGNRWTSSGVSAGIDMAAALIADLKSAAERDRACQRAELVFTTNPTADPFAL